MPDPLSQPVWELVERVAEYRERRAGEGIGLRQGPCERPPPQLARELGLEGTPQEADHDGVACAWQTSYWKEQHGCAVASDTLHGVHRQRRRGTFGQVAIEVPPWARQRATSSALVTNLTSHLEGRASMPHVVAAL